MANVYAVKTGNWSDTTVWNTGALPTTADDVFTNNFIVTIDISPTVLSVRSTSGTGITAGGQLIPANGITLTCTASLGVIAGTVAASSGFFECSLPLGQSCTLVANVATFVNTSNQQSNGAVRNTAAGTLNIIGNITGGNGNGFSGGAGNTAAVYNTSSGTINITGNVVCAGSSNNSAGVVNSGAGVVNITGNVTGHPALNSNGNNWALLNVTGTMNVIGNIAASASAAICLNGSGTLILTGTITSSTAAAAVATTNTTLSSIITTGTVIATGPFITSTNGVSPLLCFKWFWQNANAPATYYQVRTANLSIVRSLYTADSVGGNPAASNVRSGTVYGPNSELTGTCAVPAAGSVALGVPVDNTTGTAYLTQADIAAAAATGLASASAVTLNQQVNTITTPGSIGERLKNAATVATVSQQISDALSSRQ